MPTIAELLESFELLYWIYLRNVCFFTVICMVGTAVWFGVFVYIYEIVYLLPDGLLDHRAISDTFAEA